MLDETELYGEIWLPFVAAHREPLEQESPRLRLVRAAEDYLREKLDPVLIALDRASALLVNGDTNRAAELLQRNEVRTRLMYVGNLVLGTGHLRDTFDLDRSSRLSPVALEDILTIASWLAENDPSEMVRELAEDLRSELDMRDDAALRSVELSIGRQMTERSGGNPKGEFESGGEQSIEVAEALEVAAWSQWRIVQSMLVADEFVRPKDSPDWSHISPLDELSVVRTVLVEQAKTSERSAQFLAVLEAQVQGKVWDVRNLLAGPERPLISEYLWVMDSRGQL